MDRRTTPFSGRVALNTLRGAVAADSFIDGTPGQIGTPLADLLAKPNGPRDRQLLLGDGVTVIDRQDGHSFVQAAKDGYCGWVLSPCITAQDTPTHWITARASTLYAAPKVQAADLAALPMGARVQVTGTDGAFAQTTAGYIPLPHLAALSDRPTDPVTVAERLLGAPYLWGGNSGAGIDCSGLLQGAWLACGRPCPADSDMQRVLGHGIPESTPLQRGDLLFWRGHVAIVVDPIRLIHANGHTMSVAYEDTAACIARIGTDDPVIARRRP